MKIYISYFKDSFSLSSIFTLAVGLMLLIYPAFTNSAICYIIGGLLFFKGLFGLADKYIKKTDIPFTGTFWNIVLCVLGAFVALRSDVMISIIPTIFAVFLFVSGLSTLQKAAAMNSMGYPNRKYSLIFSVIKVILAALILFNPFHTALTFTRFIGACLVYDGVSGLITIIQMIKAKTARDKANRELRSLNLDKDSDIDREIPVVEAEIVEEPYNDK